MKGTLTKNSEGVWMIKWYDWIFYVSSDLHSFAAFNGDTILYGGETHWMYTELVDNGHIDGLKLYDSNEGLEVEFEMVAGYDNNGPDHFPKFARILTPEEAELKDWDGDAYKNYTNYPLATIHDHHTNILYQNRDKGWCMLNGRSMVSPHPTRHLSQEEFINKIKTDDEFAKKWGELGPNHFATYAKTIEEAELKDWDVTLNDGLEDEPYVSDDFQIGPDGAYEHTEDWPEDTTPREKAKSELINLLFCQIMDLTTMSKIELGDDVITEIKRLNEIIKIV